MTEAEPSPETVVETAADAAEELIFSRVSRSAVTDYDVTVSYEDDQLEVEIVLEAPNAEVDLDQLADDAALAAGGAVDELLEA